MTFLDLMFSPFTSDGLGQANADDCATTAPIMEPAVHECQRAMAYCKNGITDIRVETIRCGD